MGQEIKRGIFWEPESLKPAVDWIWSERTQATRFGYVMVIDRDGELERVAMGSVLDMVRLAKKHFQEDPSTFIRVVYIKSIFTCPGEEKNTSLSMHIIDWSCYSINSEIFQAFS